MDDQASRYTRTLVLATEGEREGSCGTFPGPHSYWGDGYSGETEYPCKSDGCRIGGSSRFALALVVDTVVNQTVDLPASRLSDQLPYY